MAEHDPIPSRFRSRRSRGLARLVGVWLLILGCLGSIETHALSLLEVCNKGRIPVWIATVVETRSFVINKHFDTNAWSRVDAEDCELVWSENVYPLMLNIVVGVNNAAGDFGVMGNERRQMVSSMRSVCISQQGFPSDDDDANPPCQAPYVEVPTYAEFWVTRKSNLRLEVGFSQNNVENLTAVLKRGDGSTANTSATNTPAPTPSREKGFMEMLADSYNAAQEDRRQVRAACLSWGTKTHPNLDRTAFCNCATEALVNSPSDRNRVDEVKHSGWPGLEIRGCQTDPIYTSSSQSTPPSRAVPQIPEVHLRPVKLPGPGWNVLSAELTVELANRFGMEFNVRGGDGATVREFAISRMYPDHPGEEAGLKVGDVIQKVGPRLVTIVDEDLLRYQLDSSLDAPTYLVVWEIYRDGTLMRLEIPKFGTR